MSPESKRAERVGQLVQHELGRLLTGSLKDPRIGFTTVTEVRLTPDLRAARVYVSVYGTKEERLETLARLKAAAGYLKRELGHSLDLRHVPELSFYADESLDAVARLDELIQAARSGETETPQPLASEVVPIKTYRSELGESARTLESERLAHKAKTSPPKRRRWQKKTARRRH